MFTALLALSLAAPVPKAKEVELYFPTKEGAKRVLERKFGTTRVDITETVTAVESKDGRYTVSVDRVYGRHTASTVYQVSGEGICRVELGGKGSEATPLLRLPAKAGDTWEVKWPNECPPARSTYTVGKVETVEVAAGKFNAVRVDCEIDFGNGQTQKSAEWFAPGIGVVKSESQLSGRPITQELKEFTPAK
jgi:hypothetical protein